MDTNNPVVKLCIEGTQAEFRKEMDEAKVLYQRAWDAAQNDYEACIAAHYIARIQVTDEEIFHWNKIALEKADAVTDGSVAMFYPSLYLNMGKSYELLGNQTEAQRYYEMAAELGAVHHG